MSFLAESEQNQNRSLYVNKWREVQMHCHAKFMCKILPELHVYQLLN